jgi:predicted nuclease of predicted toxin-antitoxin system
VIIWVDAQLSPAITPWLTSAFGVQSIAVRDLGLREAADRAIFLAARNASVVVMTKDSDFVRLLEEFGPPPQVIWLTCGNTSNVRLKQILANALPRAIILLESGEALVEIR